MERKVPTYEEVLADLHKPDAAAWQVQLRRWLHQHPETAFTEFLTSEKLQQELKAMDIPFTTNWGKQVSPDGSRTKGTGIIATIGTGKSPCVALRADIDGLPIKERVESPFCSLHEGRMHACGHDCHMASLMAAARWLKAHEAELPGTVRLMFQPAEEGGIGAKYMVDEGVLTLDPPVQNCFGLHCNPFVKTGTYWSRSGPLLAGSVNFKVTVIGAGGHGSMPYLTKDPTTVAAQIVLALNSFVARNTTVVDLELAGVVSVTMMSASQYPNVIPSRAELQGTIRGFNDERIQYYRDQLKKISESIAEMYGLKAEVEFTREVYPVTRNDPALFEWCDELLKDAPQVPGGCLHHDNPSPGAEDFSYFGMQVPSVYFFLGVSADPTNAKSLHSDLFEPDEKTLPYGGALLAYLGLRRLHTLSSQ